MANTPWGDTTDLKERKLRPGPDTPQKRAASKQRQRLFAALVTSCEERGYEETSVAHLIELSGVSSKSFYRHFAGKQDCFRAATADLLEGGLEITARRLGPIESPEARTHAAFECFFDLVVSQPEAARMVFVESYAAGDPAIEPLWQTIDFCGKRAQETVSAMPGREETPIELARAIIGGIYRVTHDRLQRRRESELPDLLEALWRWALSYTPPPQSLRLSTRRRHHFEASGLPPFAAQNTEQRIIRAIAAVVGEKGYGRATIAEIAGAASISQGSFYEYFEDKADALEAALDSSGSQMLAITLPAARRAPTWQQAVRIAIGTCCDFFCAEPGFARLRLGAVYGAGPAAIAHRDASGVQLLGQILAPAFDNTPDADPIVLEAIVGAAYSTMYDRLRAEGPTAMPKLAPLLTYLILTPFVGAEEACAVANSNGRRGSR